MYDAYTNVRLMAVTGMQQNVHANYFVGDFMITLPNLPYEKSALELRTYSDNLIDSVEVNTQGMDETYEVVFHLRDKTTGVLVGADGYGNNVTMV